jgi:hypothetical protein
MTTTLSRLQSLGVNVKIDPLGGDLIVDAPRNALTPELLASIKRDKAEIVEEVKADLSFWLSCVSRATSKQEIFDILDAFRPLPWTDEERAQMSRTYIPRLEDITNVQA